MAILLPTISLANVPTGQMPPAVAEWMEQVSYCVNQLASPNAMTARSLAVNSVGSEQIIPQAVGSNELAPNSVNSTNGALADLTVTNPKVVTDCIDTRTVLINSIVVPASVVAVGGPFVFGGPITIATLNIISSGSPCLIIANIGNVGNAAGANMTVTTDVLVDGVSAAQSVPILGPGLQSTVTTTAMPTLTAGPHVITLRINPNIGPGNYGNQAIIYIELKR